MFDDHGVELVPLALMPEGKVPPGIPLSRRQERALVSALVSVLRAAWLRIAVRVAGSWVAAIGLLMIGWAVRGR